MKRQKITIKRNKMSTEAQNEHSAKKKGCKIMDMNMDEMPDEIINKCNKETWTDSKKQQTYPKNTIITDTLQIIVYIAHSGPHHSMLMNQPLAKSICCHGNYLHILFNASFLVKRDSQPIPSH